METRKNVFVVILIAVAFLSSAPVAVYGQLIPFETLDQGEISRYRYGDPDFLGAEMVIRDVKTWRWFWAEHTQGLAPAPSLPKVDFSREMVLVAMLGYQTSGGNARIEIRSIAVLAGYCKFPVTSATVLVLENREPGFLDVITNPYHIVKVTRCRSIVFDRQTMENTDTTRHWPSQRRREKE